MLASFTVKLASKNTIHIHLRLGRPLPSQLHSNIEHLLGLRNSIDDAILEGLLSRPSVGFEQHFPRDLRVQFQTRQSSNAREMEAEIDGRHGEESPLAVHYAVVVAQCERACAAERVAGDESDCWKWKRHDRRQQWIETFRVGEGVAVWLIQFQTLSNIG